MKRSIAALALFAAFLLSACGGDTAAPEQKETAAPASTEVAPDKAPERPGWRTYGGAEYSIQYPAAWNLSSTSAIGAEFALFAPGVGEDVFAENINMIIQGLAGREVTLQEYSEISLGQITQIIPDCTVLEQGIFNNGTDDYFEVMYQGTQQGMKLKWKQHFYVKGGNAYVLTYSALETAFDRLTGDVTAIMSSFRING